MELKAGFTCAGLWQAFGQWTLPMEVLENILHPDTLQGFLSEPLGAPTSWLALQVIGDR